MLSKARIIRQHENVPSYPSRNAVAAGVGGIASGCRKLWPFVLRHRRSQMLLVNYRRLTGGELRRKAGGWTSAAGCAVRLALSLGA
jgi:hypothetical protein